MSYSTSSSSYSTLPRSETNINIDNKDFLPLPPRGEQDKKTMIDKNYKYVPPVVPSVPAAKIIISALKEWGMNPITNIKIPQREESYTTRIQGGNLGPVQQLIDMFNNNAFMLSYNLLEQKTYLQKVVQDHVVSSGTWQGLNNTKLIARSNNLSSPPQRALFDDIKSLDAIGWTDENSNFGVMNRNPPTTYRYPVGSNAGPPYVHDKKGDRVTLFGINWSGGRDGTLWKETKDEYKFDDAISNEMRIFLTSINSRNTIEDWISDPMYLPRSCNIANLKTEVMAKNKLLTKARMVCTTSLGQSMALSVLFNWLGQGVKHWPDGPLCVGGFTYTHGGAQKFIDWTYQVEPGKMKYCYYGDDMWVVVRCLDSTLVVYAFDFSHMGDSIHMSHLINFSIAIRKQLEKVGADIVWLNLCAALPYVAIKSARVVCNTIAVQGTSTGIADGLPGTSYFGSWCTGIVCTKATEQKIFYDVPDASFLKEHATKFVACAKTIGFTIKEGTQHGEDITRFEKGESEIINSTFLGAGFQRIEGFIFPVHTDKLDKFHASLFFINKTYKESTTPICHAILSNIGKCLSKVPTLLGYNVARMIFSKVDIIPKNDRMADLVPDPVVKAFYDTLFRDDVLVDFPSYKSILSLYKDQKSLPLFVKSDPSESDDLDYDDNELFSTDLNIPPTLINEEKIPVVDTNTVVINPNKIYIPEPINQKPGITVKKPDVMEKEKKERWHKRIDKIQQQRALAKAESKDLAEDAPTITKTERVTKALRHLMANRNRQKKRIDPFRYIMQMEATKIELAHDVPSHFTFAFLKELEKQRDILDLNLQGVVDDAIAQDGFEEIRALEEQIDSINDYRENRKQMGLEVLAFENKNGVLKLKK